MTRRLKLSLLLALTAAAIGVTACPPPSTGGGNDSGNAQADSGQPAVDSGQPAVDSGQPDAGVVCATRCPSGHCLPDGITCAECSADEHCATGKYCGAAHTCVVGCRTGEQCSSGLCDSTHQCANCLDDAECSPSNKCGTGTCAPACDALDAGSCAAGFTCCSSVCVDVTQDIAHCGGCGAACTASQFCGGSTNGCQEISYANFCLNPTAVMLQDGLAADDAAGVTLASGLTGICGSGYQVAFRSTGDGGIINTQTGQPLTRGGKIIVAPGGSYGQKVLSYLDGAGLTNPYVASDALRFRINTRDAGLPVNVLLGTVNSGHDYIVIELVREPTRGSLVLNIYGNTSEGTTAGAYYARDMILPGGASYPNRWYVFEWTADGDIYQPIASGN